MRNTKCTKFANFYNLSLEVKLCNFTNFEKLVNAVMMNFLILFFSKYALLCNRSMQETLKVFLQ